LAWSQRDFSLFVFYLFESSNWRTKTRIHEREKGICISYQSNNEIFPQGMRHGCQFRKVNFHLHLLAFAPNLRYPNRDRLDFSITSGERVLSFSPNRAQLPFLFKFFILTHSQRIIIFVPTCVTLPPLSVAPRKGQAWRSPPTPGFFI